MRPTDPGFKEYIELIWDPIDLTSILMNIYNDDYKEFSDFHKDVEWMF